MKNNNVKLIKEHFKSSTLPRLKADYGYKNNKGINQCEHITYALWYMENPRYSQQLFFDFLLHCKRTGKKACTKTGRVIDSDAMRNQIEKLIRIYEIA